MDDDRKGYFTGIYNKYLTLTQQKRKQDGMNGVKQDGMNGVQSPGPHHSSSLDHDDDNDDSLIPVTTKQEIKRKEKEVKRFGTSKVNEIRFEKIVVFDSLL
jgi:hypothetical protein